MTSNKEYPGCWYCDNILDHYDEVGLLYLGFPRCFVLIPSSEEFYFSTFDQFISGANQINWLDPSDIHNYSDQEKKEVLIKLWNFSVAQEEKEEALYGDSSN